MAKLDRSLGSAMVDDLVDRLPAAVAYVSGPDHVVVLANTAFGQLVDGPEVVGRPLRQVLRPPVAEQPPLDVLAEVLRTGRRAEAHGIEFRSQSPADAATPRYLDLVAEPVPDAAGNVTGVILQLVDVTSYLADRPRTPWPGEQTRQAHERHVRLLENSTLGVVYHDADGSVLVANRRAAETLGVAGDALPGLHPDRAGWHLVREDGQPLDWEEHPVSLALRTGRIVTDVVTGIRHGATGEQRWLSVTAIPDAIDERGRPQRAFAMLRDVTAERATAEVAHDRDTLLGRLRDANVLGILVAEEERLTDANRAFLDMVGYTEDDLASGTLDWRALTPPEWIPAGERALEQLRRSGACEPFEKEYLHASGRRVPVLLGAAVIDPVPLRWVTFVVDLSERQRAEEERVSLLTRAHTAGAEARLAEERLSLLLGAGGLVAATRDREQLLAHLTRLVVLTLADYAAVFLPDGDGRLRLAASAQGDPADGVQLARLRGVPVSHQTLLPCGSATASGHAELVRDVADQARVWEATDPVVAEVALRLGCDSAVVVALGADNQSSGVLAMGRRPERTPFAESDLGVAEELGRRLSVGLGNVDVFVREHGVAEMLQRSVLPERLPEAEGVELAVGYLPATQALDVGGDWYDAFWVGEGRLAVVLGDVVGHNLISASVMSQVRNSLRAYAVDDPDPASVLTRTNTALLRLMPDAMATAFYGVLDTATGTLTYAVAGHPPPLVLGDEGCEYLDGPAGLLLGVAPEAPYESSRCVLPPQGGLLLYSDGLVEDRGRPLEEGLAALASTFAEGCPRHAEAICERAQAVLLDPEARADDVCLLAVSLTG